MRLTVTRPFAHLCPYRPEIDEGTVEISWDLDLVELELHSLSEWLDQLADIKRSHEQITKMVKEEVEERGGVRVKVVTRWVTAGMKIEVDSDLRSKSDECST